MAQAQQLCELELNGQKFHWGGDIDVKSSWFPPGREYYDIVVTLGKEWKLEDGQALKLLPGKHTLRIWFTAQPAGKDEKIAPIRFVSNPVEFEIME